MWLPRLCRQTNIQDWQWCKMHKSGNTFRGWLNKVGTFQSFLVILANVLCMCYVHRDIKQFVVASFHCSGNFPSCTALTGGVKKGHKLTSTLLNHFIKHDKWYNFNLNPKPKNTLKQSWNLLLPSLFVKCHHIIKEKLIRYSGDLNNELVRYSGHGI